MGGGGGNLSTRNCFFLSLQTFQAGSGWLFASIDVNNWNVWPAHSFPVNFSTEYKPFISTVLTDANLLRSLLVIVMVM